MLYKIFLLNNFYHLSGPKISLLFPRISSTILVSQSESCLHKVSELTHSWLISSWNRLLQVMSNSSRNESISDSHKSIFLDVVEILLLLILLFLLSSLLFLLSQKGSIIWIALLVHLNDFFEIIDLLLYSFDFVDFVLLLVICVNFFVLNFLLELLGLLDFLRLVFNLLVDLVDELVTSFLELLLVALLLLLGILLFSGLCLLLKFTHIIFLKNLKNVFF